MISCRDSSRSSVGLCWRSVKISSSVKSGKLRRPIQLLYPLEIRSENERIVADSHESPTVDNADEVYRRLTQPRKNPRRAAAIESERRRRAMIDALI